MKKILILVSAFLITILAGQSADANGQSERLIRKADEILRQTEVASTASTGYAGVCPEANWALSVICKYQKEPVAHLLKVAEECPPAGYLMCLLGVKALDEKRFNQEVDKHRQEISQIKEKLVQCNGCIVQQFSALEALQISKESILRESIPDLVDTVRLQKEPDMEEILESAQHLGLKTPPLKP